MSHFSGGPKGDFGTCNPGDSSFINRNFYLHPRDLTRETDGVNLGLTSGKFNCDQDIPDGSVPRYPSLCPSLVGPRLPVPPGCPSYVT